jgi:hypothetical protein
VRRRLGKKKEGYRKRECLVIQGSFHVALQATNKSPAVDPLRQLFAPSTQLCDFFVVASVVRGALLDRLGLQRLRLQSYGEL